MTATMAATMTVTAAHGAPEEDASMKAITITRVQSDDELYHRYPRQTYAQPCHVALDCRTGRLWAASGSEIGSGVPAEVWHGHIQRWTIPTLRRDAANALLDEIAPHAATVCEGYEDVWDGSNRVADFDDHADAAREEIATLCESAGEYDEDCVIVWDADEWLGSLGRWERQCRDLGITATTTDEQLAMIGTECEEQAASDGIHVLDGLERHLDWLRRQARDATADSIADPEAQS